MSLLDDAESLSPMEEWRQRHNVGVYATQAGFRASTPLATAHGDTKEQALLNWADKAMVKCWKAEELERMRVPLWNEEGGGK